MTFEVARDNYIISSCCNAFAHVNDRNIYCTRCGNLIHTISPDEVIVLDNRYNSGHKQVGASVFIMNDWHYATNCSQDPTYQLVNVKCPTCGAYCRISRDLNGDVIYICSNGDCRHVFNESMKRIDDYIYTHKDTPLQ